MPTRISQSLRPEPLTAARPGAAALLVLQPLNGTFDRKQIAVPLFPEVHKIGRQTNQRTVPAVSNAYFDSKVLSRQHAEIWADKASRVWIRDVKSSNGTFVNGTRLSPENKESDPHELRESDTLELGIDIISEDQKSVLHHKVAAKVEVAGSFADSPVLNTLQYDPGTGLPIIDDINPRPGAANLLGAKPMNKWMDPTTVEQLAHKLGNELKEAKRQSHNLRRTDLHLRSMLDTAAEVAQAQPEVTAPEPPNRTLPKPGELLRTDTERPNGLHADGQVLTLLDALRMAKQEISVQSDRMKELENALRKERRARELAERRAQSLLESQEPPQEEITLLLRSSSETLNAQETQPAQARLDLMLEEMQDLRDTAERYKRRAEDAEAAQQRWAETVESFRDRHKEIVPDKDPPNGIMEKSIDRSAPQRTDSRSSKMQRDLERTLSSLLHQHHDTGQGAGQRALQSAPYMSMVGVVLIGVGLMTWLNGRPISSDT